MEDFTYRPFNCGVFECDKNGRYIMDFNDKFPDAEFGDYAYAFAKFYLGRSGKYGLVASLKSPTEVYVNGILAGKTAIWDEVMRETTVIDADVHEGWNTVFIKCRKNVLGFGCMFGQGVAKWEPVNFVTAFRENEGELGFNYCGPFKEDIYEKPLDAGAEREGFWQPCISDTEEISAEENSALYSLPVGRMLSKGSKNTVYANTFIDADNTIECAVGIKYEGEASLYIDGKKSDGQITLESGIHSACIEFQGVNEASVAQISVRGAKLCLPRNIKGVRGKWLYLSSEDIRGRAGFDGYTVYDGGEIYKTAPDTYLRPVRETELYGRSSYPLGVVLKGLLAAGKYIGDEDIVLYAHKHLLMCSRVQPLAVYDTKRFGYACVNQQMLPIESLDDCGSFTSAVLEDYLYYSHDSGLLDSVEEVADYILSRQERLENGLFYREQPGAFFEKTVWADDMYMSVPFLIRYARLKDDKKILDDAVNQLLRIKELLYMPEKKILSHVYSLRHGMPTNIPWGRGNGWVLFSLTELLEYITEDTPHYDEVREFFVSLSEGFLECIDEDGMLHQLLDDMDSYAEASCSAMCAAAFARGVKLGILPQSPYAAAAEKILDAILKYCVDENGNVYGVCVGSAYSFRREYYKNELPWNVNDTHGTGIVLIAAAEVASLDKKRENG